MANDHLYIVCDHCGQELLIAKYYPSQLFAVFGTIAPHLQNFLDKHFACREGKLGQKQSGDRMLRPADLAGYTGFYLKVSSEKTSQPLGALPLKLKG